MHCFQPTRMTININIQSKINNIFKGEDQ